LQCREPDRAAISRTTTLADAETVFFFPRLALLAAAGALLFGVSEARAGGGNYVFEGGSEAARQQVRAALDASEFSWGRVGQTITIRISQCGCAGATPGVIVLDEATLVASPFGDRYAWGIVQHEYAHQVAYLLLDDADVREARNALGGADWCYETPGVAHDDHACERFAATFAWTYWPSADNNQRSEAVVSAKAFRTLMSRLLPAHRASPQLRRGLIRSGPSGRVSARLTRAR
jgi:hypothetical protein